MRRECLECSGTARRPEGLEQRAGGNWQEKRSKCLSLKERGADVGNESQRRRKKTQFPWEGSVLVRSGNWVLFQADRCVRPEALKDLLW